MAIYRLEVKAISRSAGQSAVAKAAYRTRSDLTDQRTGERYDYRRRSPIGPTGTYVSGRAADVQTSALWNAAEASEVRKNATVAREVILALPAELDAEAHLRLVTSFTREISFRHKLAAEFAIHPPSEHPEADQRNHHAHVMLTTRRVTRDDAGELQFGEKSRELDDRATGPGEVTAWREIWEDQVNAALARSGHDARVSSKSLAAQNIDRVPQERLGPRRTAMLRKARPIWRREQAAATAEGINRSTIRGARDLRRLRQDRQKRLRAAENASRAMAAVSVTVRAAAAAPAASQPGPGPVPSPRPRPPQQAPRAPLQPIGTAGDALARAIPDRQERVDAILWLAMGRLGDNAQRAWRWAHNRTSDDARVLQEWWQKLSEKVRGHAIAWAKTPAPPPRGEGQAPDRSPPPAQPARKNLPGR
ncbi:MAG: MobA/MobL family protein [Caulobacteraceae bacterium]|nr:MobA/MobL family protein [Caulobacteraceae bacterium]